MIPLNKIISNQYSSGGQFFYRSTLKPYAGPYFIFGGKYFAGDPSDINSEEILQDINNSPTYINSQISKPTQTQYISRKISEPNISYKFIDEPTYQRLKISNGYQLIILDPGYDINSIDNNVYPGLKQFLNANLQ